MDLSVRLRFVLEFAMNLAQVTDRLAHQRTIKTLQATRNQKREDLLVTQSEAEGRRDGLVADIEARILVAH